MPLMNVFEPLFLLLALATVGSLVTCVVFAVRRKWARAVLLLRNVVLGAAVYFAVVIGVSIFTRPREYLLGESQCFEDWCVTVAEAQRLETPRDTHYEVSLRLANRAKRVPMGEKGTVVYLTDRAGHRYDPAVGPGVVPFDTVLQPGASTLVKRAFDLPREARDIGLVYRHEGGFPIGWFIISEGGWFQKPSVFRLDR